MYAELNEEQTLATILSRTLLLSVRLSYFFVVPTDTPEGYRCMILSSDKFLLWLEATRQNSGSLMICKGNGFTVRWSGMVFPAV